MEHLDEGTVHAWLDGALSPDEGKRIEEHMGTCADCSALVAEARGLIAASARILSSLDEVPRVQVESGARDAAIAGELQDALQRARHSANATVPTVEARQISVPRIARRPWWARPQLSAAAVLAVVALGSLVVTRNKDRALPNALKVP
ncbi:MAG: zf-HC2 domain-containing protein, partial [Gemmatimonadaceae bacterium]